MSTPKIDTIRQDYPDTISSEQLRKLLHVSKRRCVWLMKHYIPYTDNGNKTRRYTIRLEDAISFMQNFKFCTELYTAPAEKTSSKPYIEPPSSSEALQLILESKWENEPDLLDVAAVSRLTSYSDEAVNRWLDKGSLRSIKIQYGRVTSKTWLIEYLCGEGMRIAKKNGWHLEMLEEAAKETVRSG